MSGTGTAAPTLQLLAWLAAAPRSYEETIDVWRTSCPRLSVWEDAISDGLVQIRRNGAETGARVVLTARGEEALGAGASSADAAR